MKYILNMLNFISKDQGVYKTCVMSCAAPIYCSIIAVYKLDIHPCETHQTCQNEVIHISIVNTIISDTDVVTSALPVINMIILARSDLFGVTFLSDLVT